MVDSNPQQPHTRALPFFSYGFRPFFLGASLFAGLAIPVWVLVLGGNVDLTLHFPPRDWHVHEMVFGFLPAVITGFILTAIPNWTDRPPVRGMPLILLFTLWLAGRIAMAMPWIPSVVAVMVDSAFLIVVAGLVWREIAAGATWDRSPIGVLITLYAGANILFHVMAGNGGDTDVAFRLALALLMMLLTLIGGRITPGFTEDYLDQAGIPHKPFAFSPVDGLSIILVAAAGIAWIAQPEHSFTGWIFLGAGLSNLIRLGRWHGWSTWRDPLVLIIHIGYGWLTMSLLILGSAIQGLGLTSIDAIHALTTGAVGAMTMAVMTRASLGHTGRPKHAGGMTLLMYGLVNLGAVVRVAGISLGLGQGLTMGISGLWWSGAYLIFLVAYGPMLLAPPLDDE